MNPSEPNQSNPDTAGQLGGAPVRPAGLPRAEADRVVPSMPQSAASAERFTPSTPPAPAPASLPTPMPSPQIEPASPGIVPVTTQPDSKTAPGAKPGTHPNSTQNSLQIAEIRDGIVIMNDGSFRAVVMVKSINFDLMSPQEQESVEYAYQGFLNSLYFPIQIFLRSQKVDLRPYIEKLDKIRTEHDNMLLALLMEDYITFIDNLSRQTNIMDKKFYVVIPFFPVVDITKGMEQSKNFLKGLGGVFKPKEQHVTINESDLENAKTELRNRVQAVLAGLLQCSIQGLPLDTQELIELYYDTYNPDTATRQELKDFGNLTADIVTKGDGNAPQAHLQRELQ
jgi:hypothetical protein